jgi:glycosyltransferase involved in cell wall biosynthesis
MEHRPTRILAVTHETLRNGAPLVLLRVLEWLHAQGGYEIETLVLSDGPLTEEFARLGRVHVIPLLDPDEVLVAWREEPEPSRGRILRFNARERQRVAALAPEAAHLRGFDLLYLNSAGSARALRVLPERPPSVVAHIHELDSAFNLWVDAEDRELLLEADPTFVVVSNLVARNLIETHQVDPSRIHVRRNEFARPTPATPERIAEVREELGVGEDEVVVGAMGSAEWRKGPDLFVQMAAVLTRNRPDLALRFVWVGRTTDYHLQQYLTDASRLGLDDRLTFVGEQQDPAAWLGAFDLFCLTSREDPFPLVCLEAGSLAVPIVSFDNGGMAELAADSGPDPVIDIIDYLDVEAMANAVARKATDRELREQEGRRLQAWLDDHLLVSDGEAPIQALLDDLVRPAEGDA